VISSVSDSVDCEHAGTLCASAHGLQRDHRPAVMQQLTAVKNTRVRLRGDTFVDFYYVATYLEARDLVCDTVHNRLYYLCQLTTGAMLLSWTARPCHHLRDPGRRIPAVLESDPARYSCSALARQCYMRRRLTLFDYKGDSV